MFHVIEDQQAQTLVGRAEAIEIVMSAYRNAAAGQADVSQPSAMFMRGRTASETHFKVKGAILDDLKVAGFRLIADGPRTTESASAYLYVADADTGQPIGLVSESWLHRLRTASTGLVTCQALRPNGFDTITLIGTGRIAEEFIRSCHLVFPSVKIVLASRSPERARAAAQRWQALTAVPLSAQDISQAVPRAEVLVTLSDAAECLFKAAELPPNALVCAMGGRHEFESDVLTKSDVFVVDEMDFVCAVGNAAHWIETKQLTRAHLEERLDATVGEILSGRKTVPTGRPTLAIVQGMAICDLAIAKVALDRIASQA